MAIDWADIAFRPGAKLTAEIAEAWAWLPPDGGFEPVLCSMFGDVFFAGQGGQIFWLNCSCGTVEPACDTMGEFEAICDEGGEKMAEWFGPSLVEQLHEAGKVAQPGECYAFAILPIFAECRYEPDNLAPVPVREVLLGLSDIHRQFADQDDGAKVRMRVVE